MKPGGRTFEACVLKKTTKEPDENVFRLNET